jgi:hypothetical protein
MKTVWTTKEEWDVVHKESTIGVLADGEFLFQIDPTKISGLIAELVRWDSSCEWVHRDQIDFD